jgi:hypothetical protein
MNLLLNPLGRIICLRPKAAAEEEVRFVTDLEIVKDNSSVLDSFGCKRFDDRASLEISCCNIISAQVHTPGNVSVWMNILSVEAGKKQRKPYCEEETV